jgi:transposase-like protein
MNCPQCGVTDVIEIKHKLPDGIEVQFFSCHRCEEKWWDRDGKQIDLRQVLDIVRKARS